MSPWVRYAIAFVVFGHGFIYVRIGAVLPGPIAVWNGRSLLLGGTVTGDALRSLAIGLHVAAGIAIIGCAAAMALPSLIPGWWRPLAIAGAALGIAGFAVFWDGQTRFLAQEGVIGAVVSAILLAAAIVFPRAFDHWPA